MRPACIGSLSIACEAGTVFSLFKISGKRLWASGDICQTINMGDLKSRGSLLTMLLMASIPPAEAPITIIFASKGNSFMVRLIRNILGKVNGFSCRLIEITIMFLKGDGKQPAMFRITADAHGTTKLAKQRAGM